MVLVRLFYLVVKWFKNLTRTLTNCVLLPALTLPQGWKVKGSSSMRRPVTNAHNQINSVYIRALRANWIEIQTAGTTERLESRRARLFMASPYSGRCRRRHRRYPCKLHRSRRRRQAWLKARNRSLIVM